LPHQVVSPFKPEVISPENVAPTIIPRGPLDSTSSSKSVPDSSDTAPLISKKSSSSGPNFSGVVSTNAMLLREPIASDLLDHEYHEISDEENIDQDRLMTARSRELTQSGVENPALSENITPVDSPRFEVRFSIVWFWE